MKINDIRLNKNASCARKRYEVENHVSIHHNGIIFKSKHVSINEDCKCIAADTHALLMVDCHIIY